MFEAAAQLREYSAYFEEEKYRQTILDRYGLLAYKLKMFVIIGRRGRVSPIAARRAQTDLSNIYVHTYDEVIARMKMRIEWMRKGSGKRD